MGIWLLENTLVACAFALVTAGLVRVARLRPATAHALWLAVLGVLLMPRLPWVETPGGHLRGELRALWQAQPESQLVPELDPELLEAVDPLRVGLATSATPAGPWPGADDPGEGTPLGGLAAWLTPLWVLGALVVLLQAARRIGPFHRLVLRSRAAPPELLREVRAVARRLGVRAPEVRVVEGLASPSIWCLGRPRLLWPAAAGRADARRARGALIAHELAHLARKDHWVSWLELPAAALAWWNPLFWWIRGRVRHFAELSCDAWAVWAYPADRRFFAEALLELQAVTRTAHVPLQGLGATDSECKDFERRLDMIMRKGMFPRVSRSAMLAAAVVAALAAPGFSVGGDGTCSAPATAVVAAVEARAKGVKLSDQAVQLLKAGDSKGALALLRELVSLEPENAWAHGRIGLLLVDAGEFDAARASFLRQYELGHERPTALYNTACALALGGDREEAIRHITAAVRHGFFDTALMTRDEDLAAVRGDARFQKALADVALVAELRKELARLEGGDPAQFLAVHGELAALLTADGRLQAEHGHLAMKAGDRKGAAVAFGRQAEAGVDVPTAFYNRACARSLAGDAKGALADLELAAAKGMAYEGIAKDADLDNVRKLAGFAELQGTIVARAEEGARLRKLLVSDDAAALAEFAGDVTRPARFRALAAVALGKLQLASGSFTEAERTFTEAVELGFVVDQSAFGLAGALAGLERKDEALRCVQHALELGYSDPKAVGDLLERHALASPAEAELLVERAAAMRAKLESKRGYETKAKAWAAGAKPERAPAVAKGS